VFDEEGAVIVALNWNMHVITPVHILQSLLSIGIVFENDRVGNSLIGEHALRRVKSLLNSFLIIALNIGKCNTTNQVY